MHPNKKNRKIKLKTGHQLEHNHNHNNNNSNNTNAYINPSICHHQHHQRRNVNEDDEIPLYFLLYLEFNIDDDNNEVLSFVEF
jgi:hypothetical protein